MILGHFYLTNLLLDKMKETAATTGIEGRIVNLSSVAHLYTYEQGIIFDKINDKDRYIYQYLYVILFKLRYTLTYLILILFQNQLFR